MKSTFDLLSGVVAKFKFSERCCTKWICLKATVLPQTTLQAFNSTTSLAKQPFAFFIFYSTFLLNDNKNLQHDHCSSICNALMMITGVELNANIPSMPLCILTCNRP